MATKKRLSASERKKKICEAAKSIFLEKGFSKTTMEDVMRASELSKGGLYHHYKNTSDILYDLIVIGNENRFEVTMQFFDKHKNLSREELLVEVVLLKMLDSNEYKSLYVMLLLEAKKNLRLRKLLDKINEDSKNEFLHFIKIHNMEKELSCMLNEEFVAFITSMILSTEILNTRDILLKKDFLRKIVRNYIRDNTHK